MKTEANEPGKLKVGDLLFWSDKRGVQSAEINKVGKKYYYVRKFGRDEPILIDTLSENSPYGRVQYYKSEEEINRINEANKKRQKVMSFFNWSCRISDEDLAKVYEIIKGYLKETSTID